MNSMADLRPGAAHTEGSTSGPASRPPRLDRARLRAATSFVVLLLVWQLGATSGAWLGTPVPVLGRVPSPVAVAQTWVLLLGHGGYWGSVYQSVSRVVCGFLAAVATGVPFGLLLATSATARGLLYPVFELLRPIPPLAWVPAAIIFWPTQELSIASVIYLGAFFTIVVNVIGGARHIDGRLLQGARSLGASRLTLFRRVVLPAVLPSIFLGMEVGIGITWEVVVAAEMITGGGASTGSSSGGLGFMIWNAYVGGAYPQIVVGMLSIGLAGYASSALIRGLAPLAMPWRQTH